VLSRTVTALLGLLLSAGAAGAHSGHETHAADAGGAGLALPAAVLGGGLLVLGTSVYLNRTDQLDGRLADAGVLLGALGLLVGLTLGLV
jgi:hypothetical protein